MTKKPLPILILWMIWLIINFMVLKILAPAKIKRNISGIIEEYMETFNIMKADDTELIMKENPPIGGQQMIRIHLEELLILLIRKRYQLFPKQ